jgi:pyruvyltransferase
MFGDRTRPFVDHRVNLVYWKEGPTDNAGDLLSKVIVDAILRQQGIRTDRYVETQRQLAAIGSIIDRLVLPSTIWGSGLRTHEAKPNDVPLDVRALRGPLTAARMPLTADRQAAPVFGDPGLLLPLFYTPRAIRDKKSVVLVPHFRHLTQYSGLPEVVTTLTSDWQSFVDAIYNSRLVASSSLHGVVIAEAYGVPAVLLPDLDADEFKYKDYIAGTDRPPLIAPAPLDRILETPPLPKIPDLGAIQKRLLDSFPFDLWC